jgi:hypothetical protein
MKPSKTAPCPTSRTGMDELAHKQHKRYEFAHKRHEELRTGDSTYEIPSFTYLWTSRS